MGNTFMVMSPGLETKETEYELRNTECNVIITSALDFNKINTVLHKIGNNIKLVVVFDGKHENHLTFDELIEEGRDERLKRIPYFDINGDKDILLLMHTSGTTGQPKCVTLPHKYLFNTALEVESNLRESHLGIKCALIYPFGHISGTELIPIFIMNGQTVFLFTQFDEKSVLKSIEKYGINQLRAFPAVLRKIVQDDLMDKYNLSSLELIACTGGTFPGDIVKGLIQKYGLKFIQGDLLIIILYLDKSNIFTLEYASTEFGIAAHTSIDEEFISGSVGRVL